MANNAMTLSRDTSVQLDPEEFVDMQRQDVGKTNGYDISVFTAPQRAAIILVSMGPEYAAPIVEKLGDLQMREFINALTHLDKVPKEAILAVIADFIVLINKSRGTFRAGPARAMDMARSILAEDRFNRISSGVVYVATDSKENIWEQMAKRDTEQIAKFISAYGPEVIGYILANVPTDCAADTLSMLPAKTAASVVKQLARKQNVAPAAQKAIQELVRAEFLCAEDDSVDDTAIGYVADLLSLVSKDKREMLLDDIEKTDKPRANKIRAGMITFEDIPKRLPVTAIQLVIKEYDKSEFMNMIKVGLSDEPDVVEFLLANISQRMAVQMREGAEEMADVPAAKRDKVISNFMTFISQLEKDNKITLIKPVVED